ncbi:hypothetical protein [Sphingomonas abaci]|uniref:DNA-binding transcriptional ArsR family regulator n=1 Tax=Sphingomonas abaci TaxID=237611 RepID=A0A7W7AL14_9SPHN|nr:hypothetical protein [Sphingomonas abaci]MBB4619000.1 DNA-binding transcriptional ArsR family regulator [Sphingomonas abaci]
MLDREIEALSKQLNELRRLENAAEPIARVSSIGRVRAEWAILERLRRAHPTEVTSGSLWLAAKAAGITSPDTFRSHLHRMKEKGIIKSESRGRWSIVSGIPATPYIPEATMKKLNNIDKMVNNAQDYIRIVVHKKPSDE